ncbi:MAG TPA: HdeD family acid-resistance protein [Nocardioides sp.]|nr:HdeD family acid-resistance protein [Nocardioides sp.]
MTHDWLNLSWKMLMARGGLAIVFGILAIAWPIETAVALAFLFGIWALVDGVGSFAQAFEKNNTTSGRILLIVMGVAALIAAFFAIFSPAVAAVTLTWILGIWLIVRGAFEVFASFSASRDAPRWLLLVSAGVDVILGVLFVANPGSSAVAIAWVLGITAVVWGIAFVATGFVVRKGEGHATTASPAAGAPA